jgi:hypothetical protein
MRKYLLFVSSIVFIWIGGSVIADSYPQGGQSKEENQSLKKNTQATLEQLDRNIDLWHKANLRGNSKEIRRYEEDIFNLVRTDLAETRQLVEALQVGASSINNSADQSKKHRKAENLQEAKLRLQLKEQLAASLFRTNAFSNKYRLLGNYMEVLRSELGATQTQLAEGNSEHLQDRKEGRRE